MGQFQIRNSSDQSNCGLVNFHFYRWWLTLQLMIVLDFCSLPQCFDMGFLVYRVLNILVPLGPHVWVMACLEMALPINQFNSCCWLLLTCPSFALSKWLESATHPPVLVWEQSTLCPLGSPPAPPFLLSSLPAISGATKWWYFSVVWEC